MNTARLYGIAFVATLALGCNVETDGLKTLAGSAALRGECTDIPATVQIAAAIDVRYQDGQVERSTGLLTHQRSLRPSVVDGDYLSCPQTVQAGSSLGDLLCSSQSPYAGLVLTKVLELLDRTSTRMNVFEAACGRLSGDMTFGEPPFTAASATFNLVLDGSTVALTASVDVPTTADANSLFSQLFAVTESIEPSGPGRALGTGHVALQTTAGQQLVPFAASYRLDGASGGNLPEPINWYQSTGYACANREVRTALCEVVPAPPAQPVPLGGPLVAGFVAVSLLAAGGLTLSRNRSQARLS